MTPDHASRGHDEQRDLNTVDGGASEEIAFEQIGQMFIRLDVVEIRALVEYSY